MNVKKEELIGLETTIKQCRKCDLWKTRKNAVPGGENRNAEVLFIGEAPGYWEDVKGKPFVGKAGKVLDELLEYISLSREEIYITNILKCRPPNNRNPLQNEINTCTPYLDKQIELINPRIIATLGSFATSYILEKYDLKKGKISDIHGNMYTISSLIGITKIVPLYHPAAATYNPNMKTTMKEDFKTIQAEVE